jgi:O-antigen/teichoic acid export membrane protein
MAKMMAIEDFGLLSFGFSFGTLLATCLDFGQSLMIMKDYPQEKFKSHLYVLNSMAQKVVLILFFGAIFYIYLNLFYDGIWVKIGNRFMLFAILMAYVLYLQAILRVKNKFKESTISVVVYAFAISVVVLLYYFGKLSTLTFVTFMIYGKLLQLLITLVMCKDIFTRNWFSAKIQKFLIRNSWSFGAHFIFGTFYFTIDTQIIALLLDAKDVALYQSVFRIVYIFLIVSDVASNVLLPYLSSKYAKMERIDQLFGNILYLLMIMGCFLFLFFTSFYKEIIDILYTKEYMNAYPLVLPLSIVILLRTAASIYGTLLTISNNQINRVKVVFISMLLSIGLNFSLIPMLGILAAAWVSVLVHMVLLGGYFLYSKKDFPQIRFFTRENIIILLFTAVIFLFSNIFFKNSFALSCLLLLLWFFSVAYLMKRHKKMSVLNQILRDKGVM